MGRARVKDKLSARMGRHMDGRFDGVCAGPGNGQSPLSRCLDLGEDGAVVGG